MVQRLQIKPLTKNGYAIKSKNEEFNKMLVHTPEQLFIGYANPRLVLLLTDTGLSDVASTVPTENIRTMTLEIMHILLE